MFYGVLRMTSRICDQIDYPRQDSNLSGFYGSNDDETKSGHTGGHIDPDSDSVASHRQQALDDLQRAWKSLRRMESLSDDPAESKVAGLALAFVDRAFEELEGSKR